MTTFIQLETGRDTVRRIQAGDAISEEEMIKALIAAAQYINGKWREEAPTEKAKPEE